MANTFGRIFRLSTFGESHGPAIGAVVDGCPSGLVFDFDFLQQELNRRRPGQSRIVTQRQETDGVSVLSGVYEGKTTGAPIALLIPNEDQRSRDYEHLTSAFRPSHADFTYQQKYGHRDPRGGGRSSARETATWVAGGAIAKMLLKKQGIDIQAFVSQVGKICLEKSYTQLDFDETEKNEVRCPDPGTAAEMTQLIQQVKKSGDTVGGVVSCVVRGCPVGLGEPVFDKLHAALGHAMLSINAAKGFEIGTGFAAASMLGSEHNDLFYADGTEIRTRSNHSGGVQGGISNGMDIFFKVAFKPVATLLREQVSVNEMGEPIILAGRGRHDPCVVPRAVPIVEAMTALVLADFWMLSKLQDGK